MGKFTPTKKQEDAFKDVVKAFKKAKKTGLVFYGKQDSIVAYKKNADDYLDVGLHVCCGTGYSQVECLNSLGCIDDSGADDYGSYLSQEDEDLYS